MLEASGLSKAFGDRTLFEDVSLRIADGDRIGLVGRNGSGKTTLLRLLAELDEPDEGRVRLRKDARRGYLRQEIDHLRPRTVFEEAALSLAPLRELEAQIRAAEAEISRLGRGEAPLPEALLRRYDSLNAAFQHSGGFEAEAQLRSTLSGLGIGRELWNRPLRQLAGGRLMRLELAKLLAARAHLLLLDEPTNHLDLPSIAWFESFLRTYPGAVVVVSHDRAFLDRHVTRIAELRDGRLEKYPGHYSAFERQRLRRVQEHSARARNLGREIAAQQRFVERFGAKASKARQTQSRKKRLEQLRGELEGLPRERGGAAHARAFRDLGALGRAGLPAGGGGQDLRRCAGLRRARSERLPRGAGLPWSVRTAPANPRCCGSWPERCSPTRAASRPATGCDQLFTTSTGSIRSTPTGLFSSSSSGAPLSRTIRACAACWAAFLFSGPDADKRVGVLSGGEKARLSLAELSLSRANALLLDEPTNHLDIEGRDVLTDALADYPGTLIAISHDRRFLNALCTRIVEVTPGERGARVRSFPGSFDDYAPTPGERVLRTLPRRPRAASQDPKPLARASEGEAPGAAQARPRDRGLDRVRRGGGPGDRCAVRTARAGARRGANAGAAAPAPGAVRARGRAVRRMGADRRTRRGAEGGSGPGELRNRGQSAKLRAARTREGARGTGPRWRNW